jgi:hypothetical protein
LHIGYQTPQLSCPAAEFKVDLPSHARPHLWTVIHAPHGNAALLHHALKLLMVGQGGKDRLCRCFCIFMA